MEKNKQNATLMTTSIGDDGEVNLTYIPLHLNINALEYILQNCRADDNNKAINFILDCDSAEEFWKDMWESLEDEIDNV
ncbi:MAG: hypothetical protein PUE12_18060 [Oscillospiraceae bacterium]|nr:hypothetical protein [Oscillospiraceae bacterium]